MRHMVTHIEMSRIVSRRSSRLSVELQVHGYLCAVIAFLQFQLQTSPSGSVLDTFVSTARLRYLGIYLDIAKQAGEGHQ